MEIIASHNNLDLDGLASMVAAKKLYPDAQMIFVGTLSRQCQEFMALHKDIFNVRRAEDIPFERVTRLILVDTKEYKRIGILRRLIKNYDLEVHIYDHHPSSADDIPAHMAIVERVGATTTLLVELIMERGRNLSSFEATVLALGIYSDTGNLTFFSTTPRDAKAVAFLLSQGARLAIVSDFTSRALTEEQKSLLNTLILSAQHYLINGMKILLTKATLDEFVAGLGLLTHKLGDIEGVDLIISVVYMEDRIHVVGRSRSDTVNVKAILQEFGGAGHEKAASATIKTKDLEGVISQLTEIIKAQIKPAIVAGNIMSTPVKTVYPDTTMEEAGKVMLRYGHSGLPVVKGLQMVGVISRRDVDKALQHNLGHAPVKGYMSRNIISTSADSPLSEVQQLLIKNNIGRLPIVEGDRLIGIVSRTDVLKTLHGEAYPDMAQKLHSGQTAISEVKSVGHLILNLPVNIQILLERISSFAHQGDWKVFIVGGFVRDLLLGLENYDLDLVIEGDGVSFARDLAEFLQARVSLHEKFNTATIILPDGFRLDIASARVEYYEYPAALPQVETSSLKHDLYRRDFSINAMAISLIKNNFAQLIDYYGGREDLEKGIIRILYNLSFVEDPTRLFRAIRFEQRYNFVIEPQTLELAKRAINDNWLSKLSYQRIREEIKHIFNEAYPINAISRMRELGLWKLIFPEIKINDKVLDIINRLPSVNASLQTNLPADLVFSPWLTYLISMIHQLEFEQAADIVKRLRLNKDEEQIVTAIFTKAPKVFEVLTSEEYLKQSLIYKALDQLQPEVQAFLLANSYSLRVTKRIELYFKLRSEIKLEVTGNDLISIGIEPGPIFSEILQVIKEAKLDGKVKSLDEELSYAKEFVKSKEEQ